MFPADDKSTVRRPIGPGVVPTANRVPIALIQMPAAPADNEVGVGDYSPSGYLLPTPLPTRSRRTLNSHYALWLTSGELVRWKEVDDVALSGGGRTSTTRLRHETLFGDAGVGAPRTVDTRLSYQCPTGKYRQRFGSGNPISDRQFLSANHMGSVCTQNFLQSDAPSGAAVPIRIVPAMTQGHF